MGTITLRHVEETADYIVRLSARLYDSARRAEKFDKAAEHRSSCLDNLEGLKSLLLTSGNHETHAYQYIETLYKTVVNWP